MASGRLRLAGLPLAAMAMVVPAMAQARHFDAPPAFGGHFGQQRSWPTRADRPQDAPLAYGRHRCDRGEGGTIIGAIAGGLLGNSVGGRGDRAVGAGALAGRTVDRDC